MVEAILSRPPRVNYFIYHAEFVFVLYLLASPMLKTVYMTNTFAMRNFRRIAEFTRVVDPNRPITLVSNKDSTNDLAVSVVRR